MLFNKLPFEMTEEEMEKEVEEYFKMLDPKELIEDLLNSGFTKDEINVEIIKGDNKNVEKEGNNGN